MIGTPTRPPSSLILVHGAGSGPWVFDGWDSDLPRVVVSAVDLQAGLDIAAASHDDYARAVTSAASRLPEPVALCGWSMGGLVVLQAAAALRPQSVVLLEASPPSELQGSHPQVHVGTGTFDPETVYGPFPPGMRARPESQRARDERKRGISVPRLRCPVLVVSGDDFADERGSALAELYGAPHLRFPGFDHWDLVRRSEVRCAIASWYGLTPEPRSA